MIHADDPESGAQSAADDVAGSERWAEPPEPTTSTGRTRRIGVEIEFNDLAVSDAAQAVIATFGGEARPVSPHHIVVESAEWGAFGCELDVKFAHAEVRSQSLRWVRDRAAALSAEILPIEIICPPLPWTECHRLDGLCRSLSHRGARGTHAHPLYAFGAQLNPELPDLGADTIVATLRAYLSLRRWLRETISVDPSRRLWNFEAPFPEAYADRVLAPDYAPDIVALIDDYLAHNATRNRELDLLPLLAHLDEPRVRARLPVETINARPTWHYRLPNSEIGEPSWSLGAEWARWVAVERLAADARMLQNVAAMALKAGDDPSALEDIRRLGSALCPSV